MADGQPRDRGGKPFAHGRVAEPLTYRIYWRRLVWTHPDTGVRWHTRASRFTQGGCQQASSGKHGARRDLATTHTGERGHKLPVLRHSGDASDKDDRADQPNDAEDDSSSCESASGLLILLALPKGYRPEDDRQDGSEPPEPEYP